MKVQRFKGSEKHLSGEMTAFLAILFVLMTSFVCSIVSIASIHEMKSDRRAAADRAIYSVFGEYQKTLLEEYHIFGMDAGYESGHYSQETLLQRLQYYGAEGIDLQLTDLQFLTDNQGQAFYEQVIFYMETMYGMGIVRDLTGLTPEWEEQLVSGEEQFQETENLIQSLVQSTEDSEVLENSLAALQNTNTSHFLDKICPSGFQYSSQSFHLEQMPSKRELQQGFGSFQQRDISGILNRLLFGEYLLQNLSNAVDSEGAKGMAYEVEYVIAGKGSDKENLETVAKRIVLLRFVPNYAYLQTDESKKAEAEAIALLLSTAVLMPEISEVVAQAILLIWAYQESIEDVKTLLSGGSVSLQKNADNWSSELELLEESSSLVAQVNQSGQEGTGNTSGMRYKDYLRILLFLTKRENASMRSLDVMEYAMRHGFHQTSFRVDHCVSKMRICSRADLGYGMTFEFPTEYMYK